MPTPTKNAPQIITLGCRLNIAESEAIREIAGREMAGDRQDLIVVNSCAVTAEAVRQTRQAIRRARRDRPDARIMVTGCAAQTEPETFAAMAEVDAVIGNREKMEASHYAGMTNDLGAAEKVQVSDIMAVRETAPHMASAFAEHARAFLEVQNGCDHRCTFCIIPYGRGNSRSVPAGAVIEKARFLVDAGYKEIVLTGVDVTSYGPDLPGAPSLGLLIERILKGVPDLPRLRLSSLDSVEIDERLFDLLAHEPRMMPHLHLSLQAGDDMILKRMKRRHSRADAIRIVERLKAARADISIGADIIAGFPTEDEAMFANSLKLVEECAIVHGHIFPYSPRTGTPAARMPQVDRLRVKERAACLRSACEAQREDWLKSLLGSEQSVLVERNGLSGHAENFAPVRFAVPQPPSSIVRATITGLENGALIAQEAA
ncbi:MULTISPECIES: tRNA (N(6)-L-threonylcarbamoyladenosine(37)-C(2))-methylthiotransferase MtaB [unclassified Sphingobium]|uniref:tRNA (N(6)-L-threonylcarbamoyladenosine(37)-C(2))- methylthiotransferase MtaB n=1 Tax=unclassified Sphingobium TaxID=2611147 RepID=UPI0007700915|nr:MULTISPECIES: tRNA (N(6)-L-threonylcarbamoyladenosine(37)-C(2))-methylthiotransferase MtaB [unclassified Sphingobium]AMK22142.1 MiaB-like tRNA modifying protein [Sphingobium sp. TKS]NML88225.1 tRNA (N(6)-L-threonylcarbamoyladenosine(37)-C(2))-methylthiotransferase MtaB [Sphingobium sp. TB-6]